MLRVFKIRRGLVRSELLLKGEERGILSLEERGEAKLPCK